MSRTEDLEVIRLQKSRARRRCACFLFLLLALGAGIGLGIQYRYIDGKAMMSELKDIIGPSVTLQTQFINVQLHASATPSDHQPVKRALGQAAWDQTQLHALKYRVRSVSVCTNMTMDGPKLTDEGTPSGCVQVYAGQFSFVPSSLKTPTLALSDTTYVDFTDRLDLKRLDGKTSLGTAKIGAYGWVVVEYFHTCLVKATIPMSDGSSYYTHPLNSSRIYNGESLPVTSVLLTEGPAELVGLTCMKSQSYFKLFKPLNVTANAIFKGDVVQKLTLAFNLDAQVQATSELVAEAQLRDTSLKSVVIGAPMFAPIVHHVNESVYRETYHIDFPTGTPFYPMVSTRLELYYVDGDHDEIVAATWAPYVNGNADANVPQLQRIVGIQKETSNRLGFVNSEGHLLLTRFLRLKEQEQVQQCSMIVLDSLSDKTRPVSYRLVSISRVDN